ncbi:hypothetical protein [Clostridium sp.]|jgi:hypothetical protein|uniref:hypothetical protein n=1 Tax=Clostridium sp. TaxID=1506 RepID=UPI003EEEF498
MSEWWSTIGYFERIFWFFAFPSTTVFILQMIMTLLGLGDNGDIIDDIQDTMDEIPEDIIDLEINDSAGEVLDFKYKFKLFTIRSIVAFFTVFSWTGIVATTSGIGKIFTVLIALISGFVMMYIVSYIYYFLTKFVEDGTMNKKNAINKEGLVYLTIPKGRKGSGKVEVVVQGALRTLDAVTDGDDIPTGSKVVVISIAEDKLLLVEKID